VQGSEENAGLLDLGFRVRRGCRAFGFRVQGSKRMQGFWLLALGFEEDAGLLACALGFAVWI
jgi:hypothetical protein